MNSVNNNESAKYFFEINSSTYRNELGVKVGLETSLYKNMTNHSSIKFNGNSSQFNANFRFYKDKPFEGFYVQTGVENEHKYDWKFDPVFSGGVGYKDCWKGVLYTNTEAGLRNISNTGEIQPYFSVSIGNEFDI